jgi:hypothetical protein
LGLEDMEGICELCLLVGGLPVHGLIS